MDNTALKNRRIGDLVDQNNIRAYVLYYFGIKFYEYAEHTLEQVCQEKSLLIEHVVRELESPTRSFQDAELPLISYPIDLIIEYLKHTHFLYVNQKLPYIAQLVKSFKANHKDYDVIEKDLKTVFPLFLEDFIQHIYQEENTLFKHITMLDRAQRSITNPSKLYYIIERNTIQRFAVDHEAHDDEMEGIRRITKDYYVAPSAPLHVKVIYSELIEFEKSLKTHARIENEILFPKAMALENKVKQTFFDKVQFN